MGRPTPPDRRSLSMSTTVPGTEVLPATAKVAIQEQPVTRPQPTARLDDPAEYRWQVRLLPLMSRMIVGLTIFFFAASLGQLIYLDRTIERVPAVDLARFGLAPAAA